MLENCGFEALNIFNAHNRWGEVIPKFYGVREEVVGVGVNS